MATVTVVNIAKLVENLVKPPEDGVGWCPEHQKVAVVTAPNGKVIVVDDDGVHWTYADADKPFDISLNKKVPAQPDEAEDEDGWRGESIELFPSSRISPTIRQLLEDPKIERTEEELGTFVRTFGNRIEANYHILLGTLRDNGLNPDDYPRKSSR
jgi:hypothetical protein